MTSPSHADIMADTLIRIDRITPQARTLVHALEAASAVGSGCQRR
jgi:hypothetical protein